MKEEMLLIADQAKKEKAKTEKMVLKMTKLKTQSEESDSALSDLKEKVADLTSSIEEKEQKLSDSKHEIVTLQNTMEKVMSGLNRDEIDPIMGFFMERLLKEKKATEEQFAREKEANEVKISSLEEMIETLENMNLELNEKLVMSKKVRQD